MDDAHFDALTRRLGSRRAALVGLLGGIVAALGLSDEEAAAHNPVPRCKEVKDPRKRLACLRRARRHIRNKHTCKPKPAARFCRNSCGTTRNNCKKRVRCTCPVGKTCLLNKGCNRACSIFGVPGACPPGCTCGAQLREATTHVLCFPSSIIGCPQLPTPCETSANCPRGFFCGLAPCGDSGLVGRCFPNCPI